MHKYQLTVSEIIGVSSILDGAMGGLLRVNKTLKLIDKVKLTEKEQKKVNLRTENSATGQVIRWDDKKWTKEVEINDDEQKIIEEELVKFDEKLKSGDKNKQPEYSNRQIEGIISACEKIYPSLLEEKSTKSE